MSHVPGSVMRCRLKAVFTSFMMDTMRAGSERRVEAERRTGSETWVGWVFGADMIDLFASRDLNDVAKMYFRKRR